MKILFRNKAFYEKTFFLRLSGAGAGVGAGAEKSVIVSASAPAKKGGSGSGSATLLFLKFWPKIRAILGNNLDQVIRQSSTLPVVYL